MAAITKPAESSSSYCYFRRSAGDPLLLRTLPVPAIQPFRFQDLGEWDKEEQELFFQGWGTRREVAGRNEGEKCKFH